MATAKPSRKELAREFDSQALAWRERRYIRIIDGFFSIGRTAIRAAAVVFAIYLIATAAVAFAGRNTQIVTLVDALVRFGADRYILGTVAVLASGAWWQGRRTRGKLIKEWGTYIRELEEMIDPGRQSSGLLPSGRPRKEDIDAL